MDAVFLGLSRPAAAGLFRDQNLKVKNNFNL
jgi:hypothetical protein